MGMLLGWYAEKQMGIALSHEKGVCWVEMLATFNKCRENIKNTLLYLMYSKLTFSLKKQYCLPQLLIVNTDVSLERNKPTTT